MGLLISVDPRKSAIKRVLDSGAAASAVSFDFRFSPRAAGTAIPLQSQPARIDLLRLAGERNIQGVRVCCNAVEIDGNCLVGRGHGD